MVGVLAVPIALAQGKPPLNIVVEGVGQEAAACGITGGAIESSVTRALKAHGIEVSASAGAALHVNVNAYRARDAGSRVVVGCTTRLGVSVRGLVDPQSRIGGFGSKSGAYLVLCEAGRLLSGAQRDVAAAVTKALEEEVKACLGQLNY
jgi:hypothetical protein